jgi:hypothetical protein
VLPSKRRSVNQVATAGLILFVEEGRLSGLEYWWTSDHKPADFPPATAIGEPVVAG